MIHLNRSLMWIKQKLGTLLYLIPGRTKFNPTQDPELNHIAHRQNSAASKIMQSKGLTESKAFEILEQEAWDSPEDSMTPEVDSYRAEGRLKFSDR